MPQTSPMGSASNLVQLYGWVCHPPKFRIDDANKSHCGFWLRVHDPFTPNGMRFERFKFWVKGYRSMAEWMQMQDLAHKNVWVRGKLRCAKFSDRAMMKGKSFYFLEIMHMRVDEMGRTSTETAVLSKHELAGLKKLARKAKAAGLDMQPTIQVDPEFAAPEEDCYHPGDQP